MPELPEVETTLRGISPYAKGQTITHVEVRHFGLRWPINSDLADILNQQTINQIERRAKYLLFHCDKGCLLVHLGMSGRLSVLDQGIDAQKHDHVDIELGNGYLIRFTDPRRFGAIIWTETDPYQHQLIEHLGPEPLSEQFDAAYLSSQLKNRKTPIKTAIMNGEIVVGVGNIYANEALFLSGIHPSRKANNLTITETETLIEQIKHVLNKAITAGGTTLKDFRKSDGKPGYFSQQLHVYGRDGEQCTQCKQVIEVTKQAQRATYYCPTCQKH
jgi:formamidopyrimidine-DNA glycosylase